MAQNNTEKWSAVKRFFNLLRLDQSDITYVYVYAIFSGLITLSLPLGIQAIMGLIVGGTISTALILLIAIVTIGTALTGILKIMQITVSETIQRRIFARSAFEFAYRIPKFHLEKILKDYPPELVNRFFDTLTLQKGVPKLLMDFSTAVLQIVFGLLLISFYHPFFVFFGLILIAILLGIFRITGPGGLKTSLNESKYKYKVVYWLEELARSLTTFKMAGSNQFALKQTDALVSNYLDNRRKHFRILLIQYGNIVGFKTIITLALLLLGSTLVIRNQINIGQFVAAEIVVLLILNSVEKLILSMETIYDVLTAVEKIGSVIDLPLDQDDGLRYEEIDKNGGISVELDQVSFKYADAQRQTLKDVSLMIRSGEKVCLSGFNGSGKATLIQLMTGLYREYTGQITHNGFPLRNISRESINLHIGNYSHLSDIFRGNILENILLGHEELGLSDVIEVADKIGLSTYIQTLKEGYHTMLLPGGSNVPGSVRTKILLCRALVAKPKLLLFEEFFSKLQMEDQQQIARYLTRELSDSTVMVISNNPAIASYFDRIVIMKNGSIVADDTQERIQQSSEYRVAFYSNFQN